MKKNIEWYKHRKDSHRHPKFKLLRATYGGDGWAYEGRFWALNNIIADREDCQLDLGKMREKAVVAEELGLTIEQLNQFLDILCSEEIELLLEVELNIFTNKKIKESLEEALKTREKARQRKGLPEKRESSDELMNFSYEQNHRVKKSKVKENRGEESKVEFTRTENVDNSVNNPLSPNDPPFLLLKNSSSFTFTDYYPFDFNNDQAIKDSLTKLSSVYCNGTGITPSELTRLLNIITKTKNASRQTCFQLTAETFDEWKSFSPDKKNFRYFSSRIEGKISDALTKAREVSAAKLKDDERKETENMNSNEVFSHVARLKNKFTMD